MATQPVLASVPRSSLAAFAESGTSRVVQRNAHVFQQGDPARDIYFVLSGRIEISSVAANGRRQLHTVLTPPALFGELGPLSGEPRSAGAVALEPSVVWTVAGPAFEEFLAREPAVARSLISVLARQVISSGVLVEDLKALDLRGRVCKRLLALVVNDFDHVPADGTPVPAVTHADLASLAGGSREQVTRILVDLERAGLLSKQGRRFVLERVAPLRELAGL